MAIIRKAIPRSYQDGIKDASAVAIPLEREQVPQHLPVFTIQAAKGPLTTTFTSSTAMINTYGSDSFDEAKEYYSHQTAALNLTAGEGQMVAVRRVADATAKAAGFCLGVEYVPDTIPVSERDPLSNELLVDINGDPIPVAGATPFAGFRKRLVLMTGVTAANYKTMTEQVGTLVSTDGNATAKIVPLISGIAEVGKYGDNVGFRIEAPGLKSSNPADEAVAEQNRSMLYRWAWYERADERSTPQLRNTLTLAREVDFSLVKGATDQRTNMSYDKGRVLDLYRRNGQGIIPVAGPVRDLHFYEENIEMVLQELFDAEVAAQEQAGLPVDLEDKHEINLFESRNFAGSPYHSILEEDGGIEADMLTTHYLTGGSDGEVGEETLDVLAREFYRGNWDDPNEPLNDVAQYPISQIYDTGFTLETKYAILETMGRRHDIKVDVCTQDLAVAENNIETEISMGQSLRTRALLTPESVIHGTQTCRASVWGSMGTFTDSVFGRRLPLIFDIIYKRARYMGAASGVLNSAYKFSSRENNSVVKLTDITHTYMSFGIKNTYWDLGVNYVQYRDRSDIFWPAFQTVFSDDSSALNNDLVVSCLVDLKKQADYHWAINTNTDGLTDDEFIERSDADFGNLIEGRYDDLIDIEYGTKLYPADIARLYSWAMDINAYAGPSRTVGQYNITVFRPQ